MMPSKRRHRFPPTVAASFFVRDVIFEETRVVPSHLPAVGDGSQQASSVAASGVLVILGASGDLTKRLLMPALYNLACDGLLPEGFAVVGMARGDMNTEAFRRQQREEIAKFNTRQTFDADRWAWLESRLHFTAGEFDDAAAYIRLRELVEKVGGGTAAADNTLLYLAISPDFFTVVNQQLAAAGFTRLPGHKRIIVEKPFGKDLASAHALNEALLSLWT